MSYRDRRILPTAAVVALLLLAGCGDDGDTSEATADASADTSAPAQSSPDVLFAQLMIGHHAQAVQMSGMVPGTGVSAELVALADAVEAAQQPEIDQMTAMLARWGEEPIDNPHSLHEAGDMPGMMTLQDLAALEAAEGADFERMWLTMMIEHHEGAIVMAEELLADGSDPEALALAQVIIDTQDAEIVQMRQLVADVGP